MRSTQDLSQLQYNFVCLFILFLIVIFLILFQHRMVTHCSLDISYFSRHTTFILSLFEYILLHFQDGGTSSSQHNGVSNDSTKNLLSRSQEHNATCIRPIQNSTTVTNTTFPIEDADTTTTAPARASLDVYHPLKFSVSSQTASGSNSTQSIASACNAFDTSFHVLNNQEDMTDEKEDFSYKENPVIDDDVSMV